MGERWRHDCRRDARLSDRPIANGLEQALPVDAVFLSLHGAAAAQEPALRARFLKFLNGGKRAQHKRPLVENAGTHFELSK
jgi:hypothetical protein